MSSITIQKSLLVYILCVAVALKPTTLVKDVLCEVCDVIHFIGASYSKG